MQRSEGRILTTHAGSLPRPKALLELLVKKSRREPIDPVALEIASLDATRRAVAAQIEAGIDIGNDGEQPRESFFTYLQHCLSGFGGASRRPIMRDLLRYRTFLELKAPEFSRLSVSLMNAPRAEGPVRYVDRGTLEWECATYARVLAEQKTGFLESFRTAPSPGIVACAMEDAYYGSLDRYVEAIAEALRTEYEYIVSQGWVLQLDCPDLAMERHTLFADRPLSEFLKFVEGVVAAINRALARIPPDRVRMHVCWGNYEGPHEDDVALDAVLPLLYGARASALVLSMANPRHAHEHRTLARVPLPASWLLVAGVIDTTTNYVEHPEVVAERIELAVRAVGDVHRVIAGTDCGFATAAGLGEVAEEVVWRKLHALRAGAEIASRRLFGMPPAT
jgi:5-methyltetrahydropteroyltriglutamate--homocysteine methyltransferase